MEAGKLSDAEALLTGFAAKYPESVLFLPVAVANLILRDPQTADLHHVIVRLLFGLIRAAGQPVVEIR